MKEHGEKGVVSPIFLGLKNPWERGCLHTSPLIEIHAWEFWFLPRGVHENFQTCFGSQWMQSHSQKCLVFTHFYAPLSHSEATRIFFFILELQKLAKNNVYCSQIIDQHVQMQIQTILWILMHPYLRNPKFFHYFDHSHSNRALIPFVVVRWCSISIGFWVEVTPNDQNEMQNWRVHGIQSKKWKKI